MSDLGYLALAFVAIIAPLGLVAAYVTGAFDRRRTRKAGHRGRPGSKMQPGNPT